MASCPVLFVPVIRSASSDRDNLVRCASAHIQHMQKALTEMNIQLHKVIAEITGATGMKIIRAIIQGETARSSPL